MFIDSPISSLKSCETTNGMTTLFLITKSHWCNSQAKHIFLNLNRDTHLFFSQGSQFKQTNEQKLKQ